MERGNLYAQWHLRRNENYSRNLRQEAKVS